MISTCKNYLIEKIKEAGIPATRVYSSPEKLEQFTTSPYAVVWAPPDQQPLKRSGKLIGIERINKKVGSEMRPFKRHRTKVWDWIIVINMILVKKQISSVDPSTDDIFMLFLASLSGFTDSAGNYIDLEVGFAERPEDRSILNEDLEIDLFLTFSGGIYQDNDVPVITTVLDLEDEE
jgi:hypothetical protein